MPFIHDLQHLSVVEWFGLIVGSLIVLAVVIGVLTNLKGLARYLRISNM